MKVTDVLTQKRALRVTDVLTHPGNRCPDTCHITIREKAKQQARDLMQFMMREVLKPLLPIYHNELKYSKSGTVLKTIIIRVIRKLKDVKGLNS
jgi:hypothetical protein